MTAPSRLCSLLFMVLDFLLFLNFIAKMGSIPDKRKVRPSIYLMIKLSIQP